MSSTDTKPCGCTCPCNCTEPKPTPEPEDKGRTKDWGSVDDNPHNWKVVKMADDSTKFKVVDKDKVNVADLFRTEKGAQKFIDDAIKVYDSNPQPTTGNEIQLVYPAKQGGQVVTKTKFERSKHNQSNKKNIPRDSFYSNPKDFFKAVNAQLGGYFNIDFNDDDQFCWKILGGGHGDDNPMAGRCYAVGLNFEPGKPTTQHIAKEIKHPDTPNFDKKAKLTDLKLPDLNNKTFGIRLNYWITSKKTVAGRLDVDLSVLDKKVSDLKECPNQWQTYFTFEDDGSWKDEPYLENQGLKYKDIALGFYIRIDSIDNETQAAFLQGVETAPTGV